MSAWPEGCGRILLEETDSTNAEAARMAGTGHTGPLWVLARRQTAGRGRQGRAWSSPDGNFAASYLAPFAGTPGGAATCFAQSAGLATAEICSSYPEAVDQDIATALKWPNDVLLNGRKVAGILIENLGPGADGRQRIIVGIGINLRHHPPPVETRWPATNLVSEGQTPPDPEDVLPTLAKRLAYWLSLGSEMRLAAYRRNLAQLGCPIEARLLNETVTGTFEGVDDDGTLVLTTPNGQRRIAAADVYFPE